MKVLLVNPNTTKQMTDDMVVQASRYAREGTSVEGATAAFGAVSIEGHYEEEHGVAATLAILRERAHEYDGVVLGCFGDPGLAACREISPVPVVGIAEAAMLTACTIAHTWSVVTVIRRVEPMISDAVRRHGLRDRCASIRTTNLSVLDCEREPQRAVEELTAAARQAIDEDGAEAILLGCGGMGPLDDMISERVDVPVIDGVVCAVKLLEGLHDYGLRTSRAAAYMAPDPSKPFRAVPA